MALSPAQISELLGRLLAAHPLTPAGLIASGPFESQPLSTAYFDVTRSERLLLATRHAPEYWAELFAPSQAERQALAAPCTQPFFLLEGYPDGTRSGSWLAIHEVDALKSRWARNEARPSNPR